MSRIVSKIFFALVIAQVSFSQNTYNLKKALETARANNIGLKAQSLNIGLAEGNIISARLRPNPVLNNQSLQLADPYYFPPNTVWSNGRNRQIWWQVTKQFQLPTQRKYKIDFAENNYESSQHDYEEAERNLLGEVANKWVDVWTARKKLDMLQSIKANADSLVNTRDQKTTEFNLNQVELLTIDYEIRVRSAEQEYANQLNYLKLLLGLSGNILIDTSSRFATTIPGNIDSLLQGAVNSRPDILSLKSMAKSAHSNIRLQKALSWPTPELGVIYNPQNTVRYLGFFGTIQLPVFSRNQGEIKRSELLELQAEHHVTYNQQQIQTEVLNAYNSYQTEKTNMLKSEALLGRSNALLKNTRQSFQEKNTNLLDFLLAQKSWLEVRQQYYETLKSYMQSYIQLLYVSGMISQIAK